MEVEEGSGRVLGFKGRETTPEGETQRGTKSTRNWKSYSGTTESGRDP